jgi:hypothetical protein
MRYSKGVSWIDDCRIPFVDDKDGYTDEEWKNLYAGDRKNSNTNIGNEIKNIVRELLPKAPQGRFPANILVCDDMLNDGSIGKSNDHKWKGEDTSPIYGKYENRTRTQVYSDKGSNSRYYNIDKWFNNLIDV